jgi:hypothetical protein
MVDWILNPMTGLTEFVHFEGIERTSMSRHWSSLMSMGVIQFQFVCDYGDDYEKGRKNRKKPGAKQILE